MFSAWLIPWQKALMITQTRSPKCLTSFNSVQRAAQKLRSTLFHNINYGINIPCFCNFCRLNWLSPFSRASYTIFQNSIATWLPLKKWWAVQFFTIFKKFSLQHVLNHKSYGIRYKSYGIRYVCFPKLLGRYHNSYQLSKRSHL